MTIRSGSTGSKAMIGRPGNGTSLRDQANARKVQQLFDHNKKRFDGESGNTIVRGVIDCVDLLATVRSYIHLRRIVDRYSRIASKIAQLSKSAHIYPVPAIRYLNGMLQSLLLLNIRWEPMPLIPA